MKKTDQLISIVIPVYNCSTFIKELHNRLTKALSSFCNDYEIIFINDGSPQNEWEIISELAQVDKRVKGINFTKNFGQHYAITAGLNYASGDWFVVMDGDLQDPPEEIINLFAETSKGYDIVYARRMRRKDTFLKVMTAKLFYLTLKYLSGIKMDSKIANFGIYSKKVTTEFNKMNEFSRSFPSLIQYLGLKGIDVRPFYPDIDKAPYLLKQKQEFPNSRRYGIEGIYLPSGPKQSNSNIKTVIKTIESLNGFKK